MKTETFDYPRMSKEQVKKILENEDITIDEDIDDNDDGDEVNSEPQEIIHHVSDWKHTILMGLISGLLWAVTAGGLIGGLVTLIIGLSNHAGLRITGGILLLVIGVAVGVCAKIFYDKVKYGEV